MPRPSVVAVTSELPWPLDSGGHLRTYHLLRALAERLDVRLVVPVTDEPRVDARAALADAGIQTRLVPVGPRHVVRESARAVRAACRREPYVLFARHRHRAVHRALEQEIHARRPGALYFDHLDSATYAKVAGSIPIVLDMHNVYSRLAARAARESRHRLQSQYLRSQARLLAEVERHAVAAAHTVLAVSEDEASHFLELGARRVVVVPNGVASDSFAALPARQHDAPTIVFVGTLSWLPNASAARFLATQVLPAVRRHLPTARLLIAGKNPGRDVLSLHEPGGAVTVAANVPDIRSCFAEADVLAVPLEAGGGTRLKILEAFAAGVPVVSTPIGCEGIAGVDGEQLLVADRDRFAATIVRVLTDGALARSLARAGHGLARTQYDWSVVGRKAADVVGEAAGAQPIRVLELRSVLGTGGGPEKTILLGASCATASRVAVTVAYLRDARDGSFDITERARALAIDYVEIVERHSFDLSTLRRLRDLVRERRIDVVHAHDYKTDAYALYLARVAGVTALSTAHGWTGQGWRERRVYYPLDKQILRAFPAVVAVSSDIRRELQASGVPTSRLHTLLNGIDASQFRRSTHRTDRARRTFGLSAGEFAIGAVGRLEPQKRFDLLIDAFAAIHARHPQARLLIAGDGSLRDDLQARADRLPLGACRLLGHCPDIAALHHALDLLVQSSDYEGTPNVVLEAMAFETPIVATTAGGTAEIVRGGVDGLLVPCGDAPALARAIDDAMRDEAGRRSRAEAARRRVETDLSFTTRQAALERIYEGLRGACA